MGAELEESSVRDSLLLPPTSSRAGASPGQAVVQGAAIGAWAADGPPESTDQNLTGSCDSNTQLIGCVGPHGDVVDSTWSDLVARGHGSQFPRRAGRRCVQARDSRDLLKLNNQIARGELEAPSSQAVKSASGGRFERNNPIALPKHETSNLIAPGHVLPREQPY